MRSVKCDSPAGDAGICKVPYYYANFIVLCGKIKGFDSSITTMMCQVGSYRNCGWVVITRVVIEQ